MSPLDTAWFVEHSLTSSACFSQTLSMGQNSPTLVPLKNVTASLLTFKMRNLGLTTRATPNFHLNWVNLVVASTIPACELSTRSPYLGSVRSGSIISWLFGTVTVSVKTTRYTTGGLLRGPNLML